MPESYDKLQDDVSVLVKDFLRRELSKDFYGGKIQALVVTTNTVTGKVSIDTCNINLMADAKKMLREAYDQLDRAQIVNALHSVIMEAIRKGLPSERRKK